MAAKYTQVTAEIQQAWSALGGDCLTRIDLKLDQPQIILGDNVSLPKEIEIALHNRSDLAGFQSDDRYWWIIFSDPDITEPFALLACARGADIGSETLKSWVHLIGLTEEESVIADSALQELTIAWDRLHFLFRLSQIANRSSSLDEILDSIVHLLSEIVSAEEVFLVAFNEEEYRTAVNSAEDREIDPELIERVLMSPATYGMSELRPDLARLGKPEMEIKDIAIRGFTGPARMIRGILGVINPARGTFDASDIQLLNSVAEQVAAIVEAAWIQIRIRQQDRLERELQIATQIQSSLLPRNFPRLRGIQISTYLEPAREMGGDFYDVAYASNGSPFLMLGDVSGKGIPASIITALVHAAFHSEAIHWTSPGELIQAMNRLVYQDLDRAEAFVTAVVVKLEMDPMRFEYASAGLGDLLFWQNTEMKCLRLPPTGVPLGIDKDLVINTAEFHFFPGDILLCNSDGLTEAVNENEEPFGAHHLSDIISIAYRENTDRILRMLLGGFDDFCGQREQLDDVAVMILKILQNNGGQSVLPFTLPCELGSAKQLQAIVEDAMTLAQAEGLSISNEFKEELTLALTEVFTNQVEHAYAGRSGLITGQLEVNQANVAADLFDRGQPPSEPPKIPPMDLSNPLDRGYGLRLIEGLVDQYEYRQLEDGRNQWRLIKLWDG